ncbi:phosphoribosylformylglycinamidin [Cantharellus anzutake]|uniref:phosphoribosylformylglycinamidin n=1 Tax=Cantharellus anzutake TaxID=1750568 RepID=UPI001905E927|nr:phosphoribosylformylglycinamidin [Cantharellus anzutake]KAF8342053.1 phosphoribosylformylglycinamidin [Cantharellus anzutake]
MVALQMLILPGPSALTPVRRDVLLAKIQRLVTRVKSIDAVFIHLVQAISPEQQNILEATESKERKVLDALLSYGDDFSLPSTRSLVQNGDGQVLYITPRPGSISPWSSKATDISRMCALGNCITRLERGTAFVVETIDGHQIPPQSITSIAPLIHDRMTSIIYPHPPRVEALFNAQSPRPLRSISLGDSDTSMEEARSRLSEANKLYGMALAPDEINYIVDAFLTGPSPIGRNPTDAELFMFAQVNSEHCRHKIFNADWTIEGVLQDNSLFQMIKNTERLSGTYTISAYSDNAAVFEGSEAPRFGVAAGAEAMDGLTYSTTSESIAIIAKVETHNHPTAVSPFPGAATGSGGEIRDEGSVGRGSKPKAGLTGFSVSNLLIPGFEQPWEKDFGRPEHIASALDIMIEGPLGASAFNNEFGRPALAGYFRTFAEEVASCPTISDSDTEIRGYHKPIMIAGGVGNVRPMFAKKQHITSGAKLIVLGGPGMLIGLGGGAASSQAAGASSAELDFASVQRENAEMQRRCQQVIDACVDLRDDNPIESIHDVGAGGLSNALPELVHDADLGAELEIRDILVDDASMSPMEIWCNESQERYVLAIAPGQLERFESIAERERCPFSVVGVATKKKELVVTDRLLGTEVIHLQMSTLFGKPPKLHRNDQKYRRPVAQFDSSLSAYISDSLTLNERFTLAVNRVLHLPSVASKSFLITIGDRSITGLVTRDQMVGPWQVPVADVAVTRASYGFDVITGEAMAMGERTPLALLSPAASARMAIGEAITNMAAASVGNLSRVKLSANWMCAASYPGEGAGLYEAVRAVGLELCPALGIGIPVGKDSMSMSMRWNSGKKREVVAPLSLIVTAFSAVDNIRDTWTPQIRTDISTATVLVLIDLSKGHHRLGGSALAQVFNSIGSDAPDVEDPELLRAFFAGCQEVRRRRNDMVLAYHDRSDGGVITAIAEMCFAGRAGVTLGVGDNTADPVAFLFNEELGVLMQVRDADLEEFVRIYESAGVPPSLIQAIGQVENDRTVLSIRHCGQKIFSQPIPGLHAAWAETSYQMQALRDDPIAAREEFAAVESGTMPAIFYELPFKVTPSIPLYRTRPRVAILREQGVNGHVEMAWAFTAAGFTAVDVHMSDVISGTVSLRDFRGVAACGGFSYGDVLGAGNGWAKSILIHEGARAQFKAFFAQPGTFALAVCNGCQLFSYLQNIIPGASHWPHLKTNRSQRFEARVVMVEIVPNDVTSKSVFLRHMGGAKLPVPIAHGEGRTTWESESSQETFQSGTLTAVRYVDGNGKPTEVYPQNPNGSPKGLAGFHTEDGRVLALMPHPERAVTRESNSWYPTSSKEWGGAGPWFKIFQSAREWCEEKQNDLRLE